VRDPSDEKNSFPVRLERAKSLPDIFEIVKDAVRQETGLSRAGLMLGISELGGSPSGWIGGMFAVGANIILMNRGPLKRVERERPELYKPYAFHVLLHEFIHSVGFLDEGATRRKAYEISLNLFGPEHLATRMAEDMGPFLPGLTYAMPVRPSDGSDMELVSGFDRSSCAYIG